MKRVLFSVLAVALALSACSPAAGTEVRDAWARPAPQGANSAVYFVIRSSEADELVGVSSDVAEAAEMHESSMSGDVMEMHPMKSIPLPAGEAVRFEPGGLHVMLIGLKQDLQIGGEIQVTLQFTNQADMTITVPVQESQGRNSIGELSPGPTLSPIRARE